MKKYNTENILDQRRKKRPVGQYKIFGKWFAKVMDESLYEWVTSADQTRKILYGTDNDS